VLINSNHLQKGLGPRHWYGSAGFLERPEAGGPGFLGAPHDKVPGVCRRHAGYDPGLMKLWENLNVQEN
jgi:hypothetical protein